MTQVIYKYELSITNRVDVDMPDGARLLSVQMQRDVPYLYAVVNPANVTVRRAIYIRGTGHSMQNAEGAPFIDTFLDGPLVFHAFDGGQRP